MLQKLLRCDVIVLQETHGGTETMETIFPEISLSHKTFGSWGGNVAEGGVPTLAEKKIKNLKDVREETVIKDRCLRTAVTTNDGFTAYCCSVHHREWTSGELDKFTKEAGEDL